MPKIDQRGTLPVWRGPVARAGLILGISLALAASTAVPASAEGTSSVTGEQVSYRVARDSPDDPVRLELLDGGRVVYEYTPDESDMFLIEAESGWIRGGWRSATRSSTPRRVSGATRGFRR